MDPTTELFCGTVHCLGIFPNDFHGPRACSLSPPSLICYSFCSFAFCSFSLYFLPLFFNYCSHPVRALSLWPPMSQEKQGDATMWLCWQWHEWPRWRGHLSEDLDTGRGRRGGGRWRRRRRKDGENEKGWERWAQGSPGSTLISLFSILHGWEGILSSLGGSREKGGMRGGGFKSRRTTGKKEAKLQQILNFY